MKILHRTPKIIDVFLDDDVTPEHGWGRWSKFRLHETNRGLRLIWLGGNALSTQDFETLSKELSK